MGLSAGDGLTAHKLRRSRSGTSRPFAGVTGVVDELLSQFSILHSISRLALSERLTWTENEAITKLLRPYLVSRSSHGIPIAAAVALQFHLGVSTYPVRPGSRRATASSGCRCRHRPCACLSPTSTQPYRTPNWTRPNPPMRPKQSLQQAQRLRLPSKACDGTATQGG